MEERRDLVSSKMWDTLQKRVSVGESTFCCHCYKDSFEQESPVNVPSVVEGILWRAWYLEGLNVFPHIHYLWVRWKYRDYHGEIRQHLARSSILALPGTGGHIIHTCIRGLWLYPEKDTSLRNYPSWSCTMSWNREVQRKTHSDSLLQRVLVHVMSALPKPRKSWDLLPD